MFILLSFITYEHDDAHKIVILRVISYMNSYTYEEDFHKLLRRPLFVYKGKDFVYKIFGEIFGIKNLYL
jgi:hypothetical protein